MGRVETALPLIMVALIGVSIAVVAGVLLRLPVKLVDMGTRLSGAEREIAELDAKVKKALRRIGIEDRKAKTADQAAPAPIAHPQLPFGEDPESEEDPLDAAARMARVNGLARAKMRRR